MSVPPGRRIGRASPLRAAALHECVLLGLLVCLLAAARMLNPEFVSVETQLSLASQVFELAILTIPMTLILITGGIDLSVGATMALAAVVLGLTYDAGASVWFAAALALLTGAVAGLVNGLFVAFARLHPLIVTLATLSMYRGLAEGISRARPVSGFPSTFLNLSEASWLGIVLPGWCFAAVLTTGLVALWFTVAGHYLPAMGHNETAVRFSGVPLARAKLVLYTLSGLASGLAAVLFVARRNTAKADIGMGIELDVITAVVLGGTSVFGGQGGLVGTLLGVALLHEVRQFVSWRWNNDELILVVVGLLLIGAVLLQRALARRAT